MQSSTFSSSSSSSPAKPCPSPDTFPERSCYFPAERLNRVLEHLFLLPPVQSSTFSSSSSTSPAKPCLSPDSFPDHPSYFLAERLSSEMLERDIEAQARECGRLLEQPPDVFLTEKPYERRRLGGRLTIERRSGRDVLMVEPYVDYMWHMWRLLESMMKPEEKLAGSRFRLERDPVHYCMMFEGEFWTT